MGKIADRFKAKSLKTSISVGKVIDSPPVMPRAYGHTEPTLDKSLRNFKYVVSFDRVTQTFTADVTRAEGFHSDCYIPEGSRARSAGWVSCPMDEFMNDDFTNMHTWGHSIGMQIGTHPDDLKMLKQFFSGSMEFDKEGNSL